MNGGESGGGLGPRHAKEAFNCRLVANRDLHVGLLLKTTAGIEFLTFCEQPPHGIECRFIPLLQSFVEETNDGTIKVTQ